MTDKPKRDNQPKVATRAMTEAANARIRKHKEYWQQVEAEKTQAVGGWNDSNASFFSQFRANKGE